MENFEQEKVIKIKIPDEDMVEWIEVYRSLGMTQNEIDETLAQLNETYGKLKGSEIAEQMLENHKKYLREKYGIFMRPAEEEYFRQSFKNKFNI